MPVTPVLDPTTRDALRRLVWRLRDRRAISSVTGSEQSIFRGRGMEFDQVVRYAFGDDIRDVDWNVTARLGDLYRKRFIEEREVVVFVVFNDDPALQFGSGSKSKREVMNELVCFALLLAAMKRERVGMLHRTGEADYMMSPTRNRARLLREIVRLLQARPPDPRMPADSCRSPRPIAGVPRGSLVIWFGEIPESSPTAEWRAWSRDYDVLGVRVEDHLEREPPDSTMQLSLDPVTDCLREIHGGSVVVERHAAWKIQREKLWRQWWPDAHRRFVMDVDRDPLDQFIKMLKSGEFRAARSRPG